MFISFGVVVVGWGYLLIWYCQVLVDLCFMFVIVLLGGVVGMLLVMGVEGFVVCSVLVQVLDLVDLGYSWYVECDCIGVLVVWMIGVIISFVKMGEDLILMI